jgi:hypothetical protein
MLTVIDTNVTDGLAQDASFLLYCGGELHGGEGPAATAGTPQLHNLGF